MLSDIIWLSVGFLLVIKGGGLFVDSSVQIARSLKVPRMVVGGTIVSLATTTPELVVSATASWAGDSGIALGNAVGSCIANIGLIVGVVALLSPVSVDLADFKKRCFWMLGSAVLVILFSWRLEMSRFSGGVLLFLALLYLGFDYWAVMSRRKDSGLPVQQEDGQDKGSLKKAVFKFIFGAALVMTGSKWLVSSGIGIAHTLRIPSVIIGLTVVAVGTSLPELATAVISSRKKVADLSVGNIVGANVLNLALITGLASVIHPLSLSVFTRNYSYGWMAVMILVMMALFWKKGVAGKKAGWLLVALYAVYVAGLILHSFLQY